MMGLWLATQITCSTPPTVTLSGSQKSCIGPSTRPTVVFIEKVSSKPSLSTCENGSVRQLVCMCVVCWAWVVVLGVWLGAGGLTGWGQLIRTYQRAVLLACLPSPSEGGKEGGKPIQLKTLVPRASPSSSPKSTPRRGPW